MVCHDTLGVGKAVGKEVPKAQSGVGAASHTVAQQKAAAARPTCAQNGLATFLNQISVLALIAADSGELVQFQSLES